MRKAFPRDAHRRYVRGGMSRKKPPCAPTFGHHTLAKERTETRTFRWIDDLRRDTSYAVRMLRRSPGFSLLAILCSARHRRQRRGVQLDEGSCCVLSAGGRTGPAVRADRHQSRRSPATAMCRGRTARSPAEQHAGRRVHRERSLDHAQHRRRAERAPAAGLADYFDAIACGRCSAAASSRRGAGRNAHPVTVISIRCGQDAFAAIPTHSGSAMLRVCAHHRRRRAAGVLRDVRRLRFRFWVGLHAI